jgi:hypothetical protein
MTVRSERRRIPMMHWVLLVTCVVLAALVAFQQNVIDNQGALIHLMSRDSSELAVLKTAEAAKTPHESPGQREVIKK